MKTMSMTQIAAPNARLADSETTVIGALEKVSHHAPVPGRGLWPRYLLLLGLAVLAAWLAVSLRASIRELNAEMEVSHTNLQRSYR